MEEKKSASVEEKEEKKRAPQSVWFGLVVQTDFTNQMDVFRFLLQSPNYQTVHIVHNKDVHASDGVRVNADGTSSEYKAGDIVYPHIHCIVKVPKKIVQSKLDERFANYVHFQRLVDPQEYALYILHRTFLAIKEGKTLYDYSELKGDKALLSALYHEYYDDVADNIANFRHALQLHRGDCVSALQQLLQDGDYRTVKDIRSHAYFYSRFVTGNTG